MEPFDRKDLIQLATFTGKNCISIYIPTHKMGKEVNERQDLIVFKNHLQKISADLSEKKLQNRQIDELLKPAWELLSDTGFWNFAELGLAVFIADGFFKYIKSPVSFEEFYMMNSSFFVKPLFAITEGKKPYYILKITKKTTNLYLADKYQIQEISTDGLFPESLKDIMETYADERDYGDRPFAGGSGNTGENSQNKEKDHLLFEYFKRIDEGIRKYLGSKNIPLILAAVEYYHPIYKRANTYPHYYENGLHGNFENSSLHELHAKVNGLVENYFLNELKTQLNRFNNLINTDKVSIDLTNILKAAAIGRVEALFIKDNLPVWGKFDNETLEAHIHQDFQENDESLINKASVLTLLHGGEVFVNEKYADKIDIGAPVAALFRY